MYIFFSAIEGVGSGEREYPRAGSLFTSNIIEEIRSR